MSRKLVDKLALSETKESSNNEAKIDDNSIRVYARFRPVNLRERLEEKQNNLQDLKITIFNNNKSCNIPKYKMVNKIKKKGPRDDQINRSNDSNTYTFDEILWTDSSQIDVFNTTGKPNMAQLLKGYNSTIIAFGQTGSGKTYTLFGPENGYNKVKKLGLIPRCLDYLFNELNNRENIIKYAVNISIIEVYKEQLRDLLSIKKKKKRLDVYISTGNVIIKNVTEKECNDVNDILKYLILAQTQRQIKVVEFDGHESSRSHEIVVINVKQVLNDNSIVTSKLNFVDLAGSELSTLNKGTYNRDMYKEAGKIHMGLMALEKCIAALITNKKHIPYQDSILTKLLIDSLGGNSKTSVIITLSPHVFNREETISTLRFGERTKKVKNKAKINQEKTYGQLKNIIRELNQKIKDIERNNGVKQLRLKIKQQQSEIERLTNINNDKDKQLKLLRDSKSVVIMNDDNNSNNNESKSNNNNNDTNGSENINNSIMAFLETFMNKMDNNFDRIHKKLKNHDKRFDQIEDTMDRSNEIVHFKSETQSTGMDYLRTDDNEPEYSISATYIADENEDIKDDDLPDTNTNINNGNSIHDLVNKRRKTSRSRKTTLDRELSVNSVMFDPNDTPLLSDVNESFINDGNDDENDMINKKNQAKINSLIDEMKKYLEESRDLLKDQQNNAEIKNNDNDIKSDNGIPNQNHANYMVPNDVNADQNTYSIGAKVDILDMTFYWHSGKIIDIDPFVKKSFKVKYDNFTDKWNEYIKFSQSYRIAQYGTKCVDPNIGTHVLLSTKYGQSKYAKELRIKYGNNEVNDDNYVDLNYKHATLVNYSLMQGHIYKRNKWNTKKWTKRWFVLRKDMKLYYYEHKNDKTKKYRGIFEIKNIIEIGLYNDKTNTKTEYSFTFKTLNNKRQYYFSCLNETDLIDWLSVLDYLINSDLDFANDTNDITLNDDKKYKKSRKPTVRRSPTGFHFETKKNKPRTGRLSVGKKRLSAVVKLT